MTDMETLTDILSFLCGGERCFEIGGVALPVCQRCFGLYVGAAATGVWLVASGIWRRGLPSVSVFALHTAVLAAALLGGLHAFDAGPRWRMLCGLWTGHVGVMWLIGAAKCLWVLSDPARVKLPWRGRDKVQGLLLPVLLAVAAGTWGPLSRLGWAVWTMAVAGGAVALGIAVVATVITLGGWLLSLPARRAHIISKGDAR